MANLSLYCSALCSFSRDRKCVFSGIMWAAPHSLASWLSMTLNAELGLLSLLPGSPLTCPMLLELSFEDLLKYGLWHPLENPDYTLTSHLEAALENSESKLKSLDTLKQWLSTFVILRPFNKYSRYEVIRPTGRECTFIWQSANKCALPFSAQERARSIGVRAKSLWC